MAPVIRQNWHNISPPDAISETGNAPAPLAVKREEAAAMIGVSLRKLDGLVSAGQIPSRKLLGNRVFLVDELRSWLQQLPVANDNRAVGE